ncbi:MAG: Uma2 family endonuclease, partial [Bacteroidota bacterium]
MEVLEKPQVSAPPKRKLTYEDFARLTPPDNGNYELHNGQIIFMPSSTPPHQRTVKRVSRRMDDFVEENRLGEVLFAPMDTKLFEHDTVQPDVLFISKERSGIVGAKKIEGAPDLVVEVLSEGNTKQEMDYKKSLYASSFVKE